MGKVNSAEEIINEIVENMPFLVSEVQKEKLLAFRKKRMLDIWMDIWGRTLTVPQF